MTVEVVTDRAGFSRLEPAWRALEESAGLLGLFNGYTWQREWWNSLGPGRALRILVARDGSEISGILPLYEERRDGARCLAFIGSPGGGSDYLDLLCSDEAARAQLVYAASRLGADLMELEEVSSTSALVPEMLAQAGEARQLVVCSPRYPCPFIRISEPFDQFLAAFSRRDNLRRRQKWFSAQPGFRIVCDTSPDAAPEFMDRFFELHAQRWNLDGGSQAFSDARVGEFQSRAAIRLAQEGRARLWTLWAAGQAIAVLCAFEDRGRSLFYQCGFQPEWSSRSAGLVLFARYVQDAFDRGLKEIDLLHGDEPYKLDWAREVRQTVVIRRALTVRGRAALVWRNARQAARARVRAAIPDEISGAATRLVRQRRMRGAA